MNKLINCGIAVLFLTMLISCKKETIETVNTPVVTTTGTGGTTGSTGVTVLYQGSFVSASHPTSGSVKLVKDSTGKKFLVFDNFKTDAGPDLRVYLSEDLTAANFTEITNKVTNGTYQLEVASTVDTDKKRKVLIWCRAFSVLFGSADLK